MRTNKDKLVMMAVNGQVDHPRMGKMYVGYDGKGRLPVGTGGIVYNYAIGDCCMGIPGDHIEPGVSICNPSDKENHALETLACIGNEATILNGPAAGNKGYVTGTHGGVDHTMLYFKPEVLDKMQGDERFLIRSIGQGLKLLDHLEIFMMNIDPTLLESMEIQEENGSLLFPVVTIIPAKLMGAGLGISTLMEGDYDIMTQDKEANKKYGIDQLRFGDIVAIKDHECSYGPHFSKGAMSIGVIVHSDSYTSGHGPGVSVIATSKTEGKIKPIIDVNANLKYYFSKWER